MRILLYGDCYNDRISQGLDYLMLMHPYGNVTLVTPDTLHESLLDFDLLVLPGGADVDPARYDEVPHLFAGRVNPQYEYLDTVFLPQWISTGKPIIGICRGLQTLNVAMGGSLYQHIWGHLGNNNDRKQEWHKIYTDIHTEETDFRIYGVNSFHHQSIKRLAPDFDILGWSTVTLGCPSLRDRYLKREEEAGWTRPIAKRWIKKKSGEIVLSERYNLQSIEIIKHRTRPYIGFQYHPENLNCDLFHHLVSEMLHA